MSDRTDEVGMVLRYGHTVFRMPLDRGQRRMVRNLYRDDRQRNRYGRHEAHNHATDLAVWSIAQRVAGWAELRLTRDAPDFMRRAS
jgi:hypothetical protein